jgi:hypothetical protein
MNTAGGYLDLTFFREDAGDVHVRPTTTAEFFDEFTVRLQARARRFLGKGIQDFSEFGVHSKGSSCLHCTFKSPEQSLDENSIDTWRNLDRCLMKAWRGGPRRT